MLKIILPMKVRFLSVAGLKMLSNKPVNVATDHSLFFFFFFKFHTVIFVALALCKLNS